MSLTESGLLALIKKDEEDKKEADSDENNGPESPI